MNAALENTSERILSKISARNENVYQSNVNVSLRKKVF